MRRLLPFLFLLPFAFLSAQETVQRADAKDFDGARKMLETIVRRNDGDSDAHFQLGIMLLTISATSMQLKSIWNARSSWPTAARSIILPSAQSMARLRKTAVCLRE